MENGNLLKGLYKLNITALRKLGLEHKDNPAIMKQITDEITKRQNKAKLNKKPSGMVNMISNRIQLDDHPAMDINTNDDDNEKCHSCEKHIGKMTPTERHVPLNKAVKMLRTYYNNKYSDPSHNGLRETRFANISRVSYDIQNGVLQSLTFDLTE